MLAVPPFLWFRWLKGRRTLPPASAAFRRPAWAATPRARRNPASASLAGIGGPLS